MRTDDVIARLATDLAPVTPFRHPVRRGLEWLGGTAVFFTALVAARALFGAPVSAIPWPLMVPQAAAIVASVGAAAAAFMTVVPGTSRAILLWPAAAASFWIGGLVLGSMREGGAGSAVLADSGLEWLCVAMIVGGSALPLTAMVRMLRGGAALAPRLTMALSVLAAAGLANVGTCFSHPHTSSLVLLSWHGATVALLLLGGALSGRRVLAWPRPPQLR